MDALACGLVADICDTELAVELGPVQLGRGSDYPIYGGVYTVTPLKTAQVLTTKETVLLDDVTIHGVSFAQSVNPAGGMTCNIGGANFGK